MLGACCSGVCGTRFVSVSDGATYVPFHFENEQLRHDNGNAMHLLKRQMFKPSARMKTRSQHNLQKRTVQKTRTCTVTEHVNLCTPKQMSPLQDSAQRQIHRRRHRRRSPLGSRKR